MLRRTYDRTIALSAHPRAMWALFAVAFVESSVFPIPPDVLIIAMVIANRAKAWRIAAVATLGSTLGGLAGYAIGYFLFEAIGRPVIDFYGMEAKFEAFRHYYNEWGAWIVAAGGFTPLPYKVITIASGVTHLDLGVFALASALSRGLRFLIVAALLWRFGPPIRGFIEKHLGKLTIVFFVVLIGTFVLIRYVF